MTAILGISAQHDDSAAALVVDGEIVAAVQEERITRERRDPALPVNAIRACLRMGGLAPEQLDYVGFYEKPYQKFDRIVESYLSRVPYGLRSFTNVMPSWLKERLWVPRELRKSLGGAYRKRFLFVEHHQSHAAAAFFPSPFQEAAILTLDGVGEWATSSFGVGRGNRIELTHELRFPHSLGLLYAAVSSYVGFEGDSDGSKLANIAPLGDPTYTDLILEHLVDVKGDGSFRVNSSYFDFEAGLTTSPSFHEIFGGPPREPGSEITQRELDIAASIQKVTEEVVLRAARHVHAKTGMRNLCLSGGVALNCVANGRILREGPFEKIWIQPAAGDAGGALGVALFIGYQLLDQPRHARPGDSENGALLGPSFTNDEIRTFLEGTTAVYEDLDDDETLIERVADLLASGKVVGWFQGRMEFASRGLGSRSILADPRLHDVRGAINRMVKFREPFRPLAAAVLREHVGEYFELPGSADCPYMLFALPVSERERRQPTPDEAAARGVERVEVQRSTIPAVTHVDFSAPVQMVDSERHGIFHRLLTAFHEKTGCPLLANTGFNLDWEPIVNTPKDAYQTFMSSGMDALCLGRFLLTKSQQGPWVSIEGARRPEHMLRDLLASPCCGVDLVPGEDRLVCAACGHVFPVEGGIPRLFWSHEEVDDPSAVTEMVKAFYEETPFPNYQDDESVRSLIDKSRKGLYADMLHRAIPFNSTVLEVGCGTGQLTNFLGIACRRMVGADLCLNSLQLGEKFRSSHDLDTIAFTQMNLFRPAFKRESFDVVLCNGVLLTTRDAFAGFQNILSLVKPGGYVVIGLYNTFGRLMTDLRRQIFRVTGGRAQWLDPHLRRSSLSEDQRRAWFADQYLHPHETKHTIGEALRWFDECGVEFVRGLPAVKPDEDPPALDGLFTTTPPGNRLDHFLVQAIHIATGSLEGGFFIMIGRKPGAPPGSALSLPV